MDRRQLVAIALVIAALGLGGWYLVAGRPGAGGCPPGPEQQARGIVVSVDGTSPTEVTSFTLRTDAGQLLVIAVGQLDLAGGFNAGHLREHQATASPVLVHSRMECDRKVAFRLTDG